MRILVVDDEKIALDNITVELESALMELHKRSVFLDVTIHAFRDANEAIAFARDKHIDIAFLDIELKEMSGIELADALKKLHPSVNIIFTTAYSNYMGDAFELHASGYCLKPVSSDKLIKELENLRYIVEEEAKKRMTVKTFGNFEAFVDGMPIHFKYSKSKELLAYLIDRNGAVCTNRELVSVLWEDDMDNHFSYLKKIRSELVAELTRLGVENVLAQQWGGIAIVPERIECDYFNYLNGDDKAKSLYRGEYMTQYEWGEYTHGMLE